MTGVWKTITIGKFTEYRLMNGRKMLVQLVPTAYKGVNAWEARTNEDFYRVDAATPELAMKKVERKEWTLISLEDM